MVTAKMKLTQKGEVHDGQVALQFHADYEDDRNKEWAKYTPGASFQMTVLESVAEKFEAGGAYLVTFEKAED